MSRDSEAYDAGIRPGDVIVGFNGQPVDDPSQFFRLVADAQLGIDGDGQGAAHRPDARVQAADRLERDPRTPRDSSR